MPIQFDVCSRRSRNRKTSEAAHERIKPAKQTLRERVLEFALQRGAQGVTLHEVMQALQLSYPTASARLAELKAGMLLKATGDRRDRCAVLIPA